MTAKYRILVRPELRQHLIALSRAAKAQPHGLRDRELSALMTGLRALAEGREEEFEGRRLGFSPNHHDLRDCAELKLPVVQEHRHGHELGASHRLVYREFEADDGSLPVREAICFEPRKDDRPFAVAGTRLQRSVGARIQNLDGQSNTRPSIGLQREGQASGPVSQPLPPELRAVLAATSGVVPAGGATALGDRTHDRPRSVGHRVGSDTRER